MVISQGDVWWADLPIPTGSEAGFTRPVVIVQSDPFNASALRTAVCVPLSKSRRRAETPGCVELSSAATGLPSDSVACATGVFAVNKASLRSRAGRLSPAALAQVLAALDAVLGR